MASKFDGNATPASPRKKHSPKKTKKKGKPKDSPNGEAAMGCVPSQAVIVQSTQTNNSHLNPTIFMVNEKSFQMLRDLGELKFYHLAQYTEAGTGTAESLHHDFAAHLENPKLFLGQASTARKVTTSSYEVQERSAAGTASTHRTCKIKTDYTIHVQSTEVTKEQDDLAQRENHPKDVSNTSYEKTSAKKANSPSLHDRSEPVKVQGNVRVDNTCNSRSNSDPLDEIISVPEASNTTIRASSAGKRGNIIAEVKSPSKTKTFFGRNRVVPKIHVSSSDKDDEKFEHEPTRPNNTIDDP